MTKLSIVFTGPKYRDYCLNYAINHMAKIFTGCEIIVATNDNHLISSIRNNPLVNTIVATGDIGELPSLKFPIHDSCITNNNINKQRECCLQGIDSASNNLILRIRTDQILLNDRILELWNIVEKYPKLTLKKGRILTSSIFSINPRYSERMPYHISDMLQLGYKEDLISYFSAPEYSFEYATWYERNPHTQTSNKFEKSFRSKFAVEQWLALHYIFGCEKKFPIAFHNNCSKDIIKEFENTFIDYFAIGHPSDIGLRANKFKNYESYYNTQCYSTYEVLNMLDAKYATNFASSTPYKSKGIPKKYFNKLMPIIYSSLAQFVVKKISKNQKEKIKKILNDLTH